MKWEEDEDKDYVIMTKEDNASNESGSTNEEEDQGCPKVLLDDESNVREMHWEILCNLIYSFICFICL